MVSHSTGYATGKRHMRDREAIDVTLDVLEALVAIRPNSARLEELDHKRHDGELSEADYAEWMELQDRGIWFTATSNRST
jgi:hypothetical protein